MYRIVNTDINLQCGRDCNSFKDAVQMRARFLAQLPDLKLAIRTIPFPTITQPGE